MSSEKFSNLTEKVLHLNVRLFKIKFIIYIYNKDMETLQNETLALLNVTQGISSIQELVF